MLALSRYMVYSNSISREKRNHYEKLWNGKNFDCKTISRNDG